MLVTAFFEQSFVCFIIVAATVLQARAQSPADPASARIETSMSEQANSSNVQAWLKSNDPRLMAWGAYYARENNDTSALELAAHLIQASLTQGGPGLFSADRPHADALSEILDALIERHVILSADLLGYVAQSHPIQAIILLSMLPAGEQTGNLEQWFGGARPAGDEHLDRVSAMLLSKAPPAGFAASILRGSEENLIFHIVPKTGQHLGFYGSGFTGSMCLDFASSSQLAAWPQIFSYQLTEAGNSIDPLLVEAGGDHIYWQRSTPGGGFRTCVGSVKGLTAETRHHLLAGMLGMRDMDMSWATRQDVAIENESDEQVQRSIGAAILAERALLLQSVQQFQAMQLITPQEAQATLPKLSITVSYDPAISHEILPD